MKLDSIKDLLYSTLETSISLFKNDYEALLTFISKNYTQHIKTINNYSFEEKFESFEKWLNDWIKKEEFASAEAIIINPFITSEYLVILNIQLSAWWDDSNSDWVADTYTQDCFDELYLGIQELCKEENFGKIFSIVLGVIFIKRYCYKNMNSIISSIDSNTIYLTTTNFDELITFGSLTKNGYKQELHIQ